MHGQRNLLAALIAFVLAACGGKTLGDGRGDGTGSETDWLSMCNDDSECPQGSCICGVCTLPCDEEAACDPIRRASCFDSPALAGCEMPPPRDTGICATEAVREIVEEGLDGGTLRVFRDSVDGSTEGLDGGARGSDGPSQGAEGPGGGPGGAEDPWIDYLRQSSITKLDLLFMIDNSLSMGDKQRLLAEALPDLVYRLVSPPCIGDDGAIASPVNGACPAGTRLEFQPINDIHVGVITSSLGGFGSELDCISAEEGETDNSHLLGSLPRVQAVLPSTPTFLSWCAPGSDSAVNGDCAVTAETSDGNASAFSQVFSDQVQAADEQGCGWEASLEAWYRFLVEPYPWTKVVRQNCPFANDMSQLCIGPEADSATGLPYVDDVILQQRQAFLRADSLLTVVMLTDENDCSFKASGQSWRLSQTFRTDSQGNRASSRAYKGAAICQTDPNDPCCVSCGAGVPQGCPTGVNADDGTVSAGCEEPLYPSLDALAQAGSSEPTDDAVNLRCFDQKRRFGVDYLYPVSRYTNALQLENICPFADDLDPNAVGSDGTKLCGRNQEFVVQNPLYTDLSYEARRAADPNAVRVIARDPSLVYLAGIVGVPWQDLAVDRNAETLVYRSNSPDASNAIDWNLLLGNSATGTPYDLAASPPGDPLMHEQLEARTGADSSINGGEWNILERDDLQYACVFDLDEPVPCPSIDDLGENVTVTCECTYYGDEAYANPLCDGLNQTRAKAYPSIRPLQVLRDYGANSIVASICPKNTTVADTADYGYRPAVAAILDRMKEQLEHKCLARALPIEEVDGELQANCSILEVTPGEDSCDAVTARSEVDADIDRGVREMLVRTNVCKQVDGDCLDFHTCELAPLEPGSQDMEACLNEEIPSGNGWCYVDPSLGLGDSGQVEKCPATEQRKIRFAGAAAPRLGSFVLLACEPE